MRAFILTLALSLPLALMGCPDPGESQAVEDYEEATEGPIEEEFTEDDITDSDDAFIGTGDGNDATFGAYDLDGDGYINETEFVDAGLVGVYTTYDTDGDGLLSEEEYGAYQMENM